MIPKSKKKSKFGVVKRFLSKKVSTKSDGDKDVITTTTTTTTETITTKMETEKTEIPKKGKIMTPPKTH